MNKYKFYDVIEFTQVACHLWILATSAVKKKSFKLHTDVEDAAGN